jgi:hypothetical protein
MGVILVKSGEPEVRLPIWVCQAAPGGTGDLLNYCLLHSRHEPAFGVDAVRCTVVKATLLRSQPCAMLPRARQVALARSNLIFSMRRRSHKTQGQLPTDWARLGARRAAHRHDCDWGKEQIKEVQISSHSTPPPLMGAVMSCY